MKRCSPIARSMLRLADALPRFRPSTAMAAAALLCAVYALGPPAAGDVLAVCAQDLAEELEVHPGDDAREVCRSMVAALVALRQSL